MPTGRQGSIRLFRFSGIDVFLHWSWFLVAAYEISSRKGAYSSVTWNVVEYLSLFVIVLLHEFGHALACRQVGGTADHIVLWPLGGVAYVNPPQRPGATLWSIAAGPLVNVGLLILLEIIGFDPTGIIAHSVNAWPTDPNLHHLLETVASINFGLLIFNILPIYPLDGGQMLRALLWFAIGRARSLLAATGIGLLGAAGLIYLALTSQSLWMGMISLYVLMNCWSGFQQARALSNFAKLPRRENFACPNCKTSPPIGEYWRCSKCGQPFDTFQTGGVCPNCRSHFEVTRCLDCGTVSPIHTWSVPVIASSGDFTGSKI